MTRKVPLISYRSGEKKVIGEVEIDNYEKVTITITGAKVVEELTESTKDSFSLMEIGSTESFWTDI